MMAVQSVPRLLLLAYFYPPLGGPAVQRPCKTVKYLTQLGWAVDVITIKGIVYHSLDTTLLDECSHRKVFRTASLDPMFLLQKLKNLLRWDMDKLYFGTPSARKRSIKKCFPIDDKIGWLPFAVRAGRQALLTDRYAAVMVSCGPFSAALAGRRLARLAKIPFILDYRDHWTLSNIAVQPRGLLFTWLQALEKSLLHSTDLVLTATSRMRDDLISRFGKDLTERLQPIFNGWDEADFTGLTRQRKPDGSFRLCYVGALYGERSLLPLLNGLRQAFEAHPEQPFELRFIGNYYPETHQEVETSGIKPYSVFVPQQPHALAIQQMLDADLLILIIGGKEYNWVLSGKLFEYLRSQRPILALVDESSETAALLHACGHHAICPLDDADAIRACLEQLYQDILEGKTEFTIPVEYERSVQVRTLDARIKNL